MQKANNNNKKSSLRIARTAMPDTGLSRTSNTDDQEKFKLLLRSHSNELNLILDAKGKIKYCNEAIKQLLNYDASKITGNSFHALIPIDQALVFRAALRASSEEGDAAIVIDCQLLNRGGKKIFFRMSIRDYRHHPHIEGYMIHATNITRLKYQENKLSISQTILSCQEDAIVLLDWKSRKIKYANQPFLELSGFTKSELFGGKLNLFAAPYNQFLFAEGTDYKEIVRFKKFMEKNKAYKGRVYSKKKNGNVFYNRIRVVPILDHDQNLSQYYVSMKAIKPRKKS